MFVASFFAATILLLPVLFIIIQFLVSASLNLNILSIDWNRSLIACLGGIICLLFWRKFRWRARGAAQGFAREVARSICSEFQINKGIKC